MRDLCDDNDDDDDVLALEALSLLALTPALGLPAPLGYFRSSARVF